MRSTGELQEETNFVGQLYLNGQLIKGIKSPVPILLQPGQNGTITMPVLVAKNGEYSLTGTASFAGPQATRRPFRSGWGRRLYRSFTKSGPGW